MFARISHIRFAALAGLVAASTALFAEDIASAKQELTLNYANLGTSVSTVRTFADAPKSFDAVNASDDDLARFGFPPRPDPRSQPEHYAMWTRAMQAAKIRWHGEIRPVSMKSSNDASLPIEPMEPNMAAAAQPVSSTSLDWSGVVLTKNLGAYSSTQSFSDIYSLMTVQVGQLPFETGCNPNVDDLEFDQYTWIGLNGYVKNASIQPGPTRGALWGGVWTQVQCNPYLPYPAAYHAMFGWTPGPNFMAFSVNPGDIVYAEVGAPAGGTQSSYLFIEDLTTLTYGAFSVGVPSGLTYVGDTAEWIVSRPCCRASGFPYALLNTGETFFDGGAALDHAGNTLYPGSQASSTHLLTMRDDYNDQSIELVHQGATGYEGTHGVMFQTIGCAWSGPCPVRH